MGKIITVWGNAGSGKSVFSCVLARYLTGKKEKVIIINADAGTPMLPVWMPERLLETNASFGHVLTATEINTAVIAGRVTLDKNNPNLGVMGYAADETPFSYPEVTQERIREVYLETSKLVDYLILDCSSHVINYFTPTAIEAADYIIRIITPDLRGISYLKSHKAVLTDIKFHYNEHLTFAGLARPFHPLEELENVVGHLDGMLPYNKEIDRACTNGGMLNLLSFLDKQYLSSVQDLYKKISQDVDGIGADNQDDVQHMEMDSEGEHDFYVESVEADNPMDADAVKDGYEDDTENFEKQIGNGIKENISKDSTLNEPDIEVVTKKGKDKKKGMQSKADKNTLNLKNKELDPEGHNEDPDAICEKKKAKKPRIRKEDLMEISQDSKDDSPSVSQPSENQQEDSDEIFTKEDVVETRLEDLLNGIIETDKEQLMDEGRDCHEP